MQAKCTCVKTFSPRTKDKTTIKGERLFALEDGQSLKIINTEKSDSGEYVCTASNMEGISKITVVLDVKGMSATQD